MDVIEEVPELLHLSHSLGQIIEQSVASENV